MPVPSAGVRGANTVYRSVCQCPSSSGLDICVKVLGVNHRLCDKGHCQMVTAGCMLIGMSIGVWLTAVSTCLSLIRMSTTIKVCVKCVRTFRARERYCPVERKRSWCIYIEGQGPVDQAAALPEVGDRKAWSSRGGHRGAWTSKSMVMGRDDDDDEDGPRRTECRGR